MKAILKLLLLSVFAIVVAAVNPQETLERLHKYERYLGELKGIVHAHNNILGRYQTLILQKEHAAKEAEHNLRAAIDSAHALAKEEQEAAAKTSHTDDVWSMVTGAVEELGANAEKFVRSEAGYDDKGAAKEAEDLLSKDSVEVYNAFGKVLNRKDINGLNSHDFDNLKAVVLRINHFRPQ